MKLSLEKVKLLCYQQDTTLGSMLREAGVSRNAFYTLARNEAVVPQSILQVAARLDVPVSELLTDTVPPAERMRSLASETPTGSIVPCSSWGAGSRRGAPFRIIVATNPAISPR